MKKYKKIPEFLGDRGQTAVEYILLFSVVIVMVISFMKYVQERIIGDPSQCEAQTTTSMTCQVYGIFDAYSGSYRKFMFFRIF